MGQIQTDLASRKSCSRSFFWWRPSCRLRRRLSMWSLLSVTFGVFYFNAPREAEAQVTILYSFGSGQASDGVEPLGGLVQASDGSFYATTYAQLGNFSAMFPSGTIYQFQPSSGELAFLKSFPNRSQREPQSPVLPCKG